MSDVRFRQVGEHKVLTGIGVRYRDREVLVDGRRVGVLYPGMTRHRGYEARDGWYFDLDHDPQGVGQTWYYSLDDARERIPQVLPR